MRSRRSREPRYDPVATTAQATTNPFEYRLFAEVFSGYLRQERGRWRLRRTDLYSPTGLNLARRRIRLDVRIDRRLFRDFLRIYGPDLEIPAGASAAAPEVTAFLPVLSHPKRLLLQAQQECSGASIAALQRYDESRILARDILALLYNRRTPGDQAGAVELDDLARTPRMRVLLAALFFNDPHRLKERLDVWCKDRRRILYPNWGLADETTLLEWIADEAEDFLPGLGEQLCVQLESYVAEHVGGGNGDNRIDSVYRPGGLEYFPTFETLLLHGIQDVLKLLTEVESPRLRNGARPPRERLLSDPTELGRRVSGLLAETRTLSLLVEAQTANDAYRDLVRHLDRWVSYAVVTFRPSVPFTIEFEDTYPLDRPGGKKLSFRERTQRITGTTTHHYPLPVRDAQSVHVEVTSEDLELIARQDESRVLRLNPDTTLEVEKGFFGQKLEPSERLQHRYSSKRPEKGIEVEAGPGVPGSLWLEVPYRLLGAVKAGYLAATVTFGAAAAFVATSVAWSLYDGRTAGLQSDTILIGTIATTLVLWLTATQYRSSIVHRKLFLARYTMYASILVTLVALATLALAAAFDWRTTPLSSTQQSGARVSSFQSGAARTPSGEGDWQEAPYLASRRLPR